MGYQAAELGFVDLIAEHVVAELAVVVVGVFVVLAAAPAVKIFHESPGPEAVWLEHLR